MIRRWWPWLAWTVTAGIFCFFENNTGTRVLLVWSLLLPLILRLIGTETPPERPRPRAEKRTEPRETQTAGDTDEPGQIREYIPGDPIRRIHWKLSAKTGRLLIRENDTAPEIMTAVGTRQITADGRKEPRSDTMRRKAALLALAVFAVSAVLLIALPGPRNGAASLLNALFDRSEAVNAYRYVRLRVPAGQGSGPAWPFLGTAAASVIAMILLSKSRVQALTAAVLLAAGQAYLGLSLPAWANIVLFCPLILLVLPRRWNRGRLLACVAALMAVAMIVALVRPGVDAGIENASERVRDALSRMTGQTAGESAEMPPSVTDARHVHTQSLLRGGNSAVIARTYRLLTVEEQQIALPRWFDYMRTILYLLLTVAVIVLPFLPFAVLNRRRKRAMEARRVFGSDHYAEAICAMFRHVIAWLESTGHGCGNLLYREWPDRLRPAMREEYAENFEAGALLFEEASYSDHAMTEEQREKLAELLAQTERMLYRRADWKKRLRLRYVECLWIGSGEP